MSWPPFRQLNRKHVQEGDFNLCISPGTCRFGRPRAADAPILIPKRRFFLLSFFRNSILQTLLDWGPGEGCTQLRWLGGTTEQAILTEAGTGRAAVGPGLTAREADRQPHATVSWDSRSSSPVPRPERNLEKKSGRTLAMAVSPGGGRIYGVSPCHRAGCKFCVPGIPPSTMIAPSDFGMGPVGRQEPDKLCSSEILRRPSCAFAG